MTPDEQRRQPLPRFGFRTALAAAFVVALHGGLFQ